MELYVYYMDHIHLFFSFFSLLQTLTYDTPAAGTSASSVLVKVANETLPCFTSFTYYPEPEFTSFTSTRTGESVLITIQVIHVFQHICTHRGHRCIKKVLCCHFRKRQTSWRWPQESCQWSASRRKNLTTATWKSKVKVTRRTLSPVKLQPQLIPSFRCWR